VYVAVARVHHTRIVIDIALAWVHIGALNAAELNDRTGIRVCQYLYANAIRFTTCLAVVPEDAAVHFQHDVGVAGKAAATARAVAIERAVRDVNRSRTVCLHPAASILKDSAKDMIVIEYAVCQCNITVIGVNRPASSA
jgi:hypothetical protein